MKCKVAEQLEHLVRPIESLRFDPSNTRTHDDRNLSSIEQSLLAFGQVKPVVFHPDDGTVIAGNGTLAAAQRLGWTHLAATPMVGPGWAREYAIADNRTAELAEWDYGQLLANLGEVPEHLLATIGFTAEELAALSSHVGSGDEQDTGDVKAKTSVRVLKVRSGHVEMIMDGLSVRMTEAGLTYSPRSY